LAREKRGKQRRVTVVRLQPDLFLIYIIIDTIGKNTEKKRRKKRRRGDGGQGQRGFLDVNVYFFSFSPISAGDEGEKKRGREGE